MKDYIHYVMAWVLLALLFSVATYDVYANWRWGSEYTVSHVFQAWSRKFPMVAFGFGVTVGHLLWPVSLTGVVGNDKPHIG